MRILHVYTRFNAGGPARIALDLLPRLEAMGAENHLAVGALPPGEVGWEAEAEARGLPVHRVAGLGKGESTVAGIRGIRGLIRSLRPQIVNTHMARAGVLGRVAAWRERVPARVHTFHGHLFRGYFGPLRCWAIRRIERALGRITTGLTTVSEQVRADLEGLGVVAPGRLAVIPPALDLSPYFGGDSRSDEPVRIGWAGRLTAIKNPDLFGRIASLLPGCRFEAVGEGELLPLLRSRHPEVGWLGHREDMAAWLRGLRVLVLTSVNEGLPLILIEAMAAGVPVVATPAGGVVDLIDDERTGILVPSGDPASCAALVRRLVGDESLRGALVAAGRKRAEAFAVERVAPLTWAYYQSLFG